MVEKVAIDRFDGRMAVLMVDDKPVVVKRSSLPKGAKEGDWLEVEFDGLQVVSARIDPETKAQMEAMIAGKLARLRKGKA